MYVFGQPAYLPSEEPEAAPERQDPLKYILGLAKQMQFICADLSESEINEDYSFLFGFAQKYKELKNLYNKLHAKSQKSLFEERDSDNIRQENLFEDAFDSHISNAERTPISYEGLDKELECMISERDTWGLTQEEIQDIEDSIKRIKEID